MKTPSERTSPRVVRLALASLDPLDEFLELMYFALRGMTREADDVLAAHGMGRAHHRILFVIARRDGLAVGDLRACLGVSAQAMHRPLKRLLDGGFVMSERDPQRHRVKSLHLTEAGRAVEYEASERERATMRSAFMEAGAEAHRGWSSVMERVASNA